MSIGDKFVKDIADDTRLIGGGVITSWVEPNSIGCLASVSEEKTKLHNDISKFQKMHFTH